MNHNLEPDLKEKAPLKQWACISLVFAAIGTVISAMNQLTSLMIIGLTLALINCLFIFRGEDN